MLAQRRPKAVLQGVRPGANAANTFAPGRTPAHPLQRALVAVRREPSSSTYINTHSTHLLYSHGVAKKRGAAKNRSCQMDDTFVRRNQYDGRRQTPRIQNHAALDTEFLGTKNRLFGYRIKWAGLLPPLTSRHQIEMQGHLTRSNRTKIAWRISPLQSKSQDYEKTCRLI